MSWIFLLALILLIGLWAVFTFNTLVRRRNLVAEAWSGIEAQLKRRADLIPNLVETVKGYAAHERSTLDELTRLRGAAHGGSAKSPPSSGEVAATAEVERQIGAMIGRIMVVAEAYPDLKASANFQSLQRDLADIEDEVQLSRRYYNGAVRDYNVTIEQVPSNLIASTFAFHKADFFEIENAADRSVPRVAFS